MKEKIILGLLSGALGLLMLFCGVNRFNIGANPFLATAICAFIVGASYLCACALGLLRLEEKVPALGRVVYGVELLGLPVYLVVEIIVEMTVLGAQGIGIGAWIMDIIILGAITALLVFGILSIIKEDKAFRLGRDLSLGCVLLILPLMLVYTQNGGMNTIGTISLFDLFIRLFYFGIAFFVLKDSLLLVKDKLTAERPFVETAAAEAEPFEEEKAEESVEEEKAEEAADEAEEAKEEKAE